MTQASRAAVPGFTPTRGVAVDRAGALVEATEDATGRRVLLRILSPALTADSQLMRRIRGHSGLIVSMRHPNLVTVLAVADRGQAIVYEWIDGATVRRAVDAGGMFDIAASFVLLDDVLTALDGLHRRRILHRDLRPDCVLIDASGTVLVRDADVPSPPLRADWRAGTPQYMAPELWQGAEHSVAGDLYAATCIFAEVLAGRAPYEATDVATLQRLHERGDLPGTNLAAPIRGLIAEGMAKDPRQRPVDASRFRADLDVAAGAYLDDDWRRRGRAWLADTARARLADPPPPPAADGEVALAASTVLLTPWWRNGRVLLGILVAAIVLVVLAVIAASALTSPATPSTTPAPVPVTTTPAQPSGAPTNTQSASAASSPAQSATPVPTPTQITANPSATVSIAPVVSPTPSSTPVISPCPTVLITPCPVPT